MEVERDKEATRGYELGYKLVDVLTELSLNEHINQALVYLLCAFHSRSILRVAVLDLSVTVIV